MRSIYLEFETGSPGCCGLTEIFNFPQLGIYKDTGPDRGVFQSERSITSNEWLNAFSIANCEPGEPAHFFFSHAHHQVGPATPKKFANWLRRQGEHVVSTPPRRNPGGQGIITAYFWSPSKKFINKYNKLQEKQNQDGAGSSDSY